MLSLLSLIRSIAIGIVTLVTILGSGLVTPNINENATSTKVVVENRPKITNTPKTPQSSTTTVTNNKISTTTTTKPIVTTKSTTTPKNTMASKPAEKLELSIKPITPILPLPTISEVNELTRSALVNIICTTGSGGTLNPITGSGVIIDDRGVILTNAHIGQFFLLRDFPTKDNIECTIRTGSPAYPHYKAELLYISKKWIEDNGKNITSTNPMGTGENDFALLFITGSVNQNESLPASFPYIVPNINELTESEISTDSYVVAGYPAGFLGGIAVQKDLFLTSANVAAKQIFTFKEKTIDVISLGGSAVAQKGASGGALVRQKDKKLVGIVVTTTEEKTTRERDLRAITTTHINRSLKDSVGKTLPEFLTGNLSQKVLEFKVGTFQILKSILINAILS